jgi:hypothetical protein
LFPDPLVSAFSSAGLRFQSIGFHPQSVFSTDHPDLQFSLSAESVYAFRPPAYPTPAQFFPTADPDPRSVGIRLWLCKNPFSPSRRMLCRFRLPFTVFCSSAPPSTSPLPPVKVDNHGNSFSATVRMKPIPVGTATVVPVCTPPCLLLCDGTALLDFKPLPLLYKYRQ